MSATDGIPPCWIVTGGAGFIGSNFVRHVLAHARARVVVVDRLTYAGNLATIEDVLRDPAVRFVEADIADPEAMGRLFGEEQPRAVVNFAAESHVDRSIDGPENFLHSNTVGVFVLLEAARRHVAALPAPERSRFRFLQVSTDEVYGTLGPTGRFAETSPYAPRSPYSATKASADHLLEAWHETYGLPTLLTNCSNNYGPYQYPEKLIPLMTLNALEGRPLPVYGTGANVRDWLHVEDHCRAILLVLERGRPGERYNVGADGERTNLQVVRALCRALEAVRPAGGNEALRARGIRAYEDLVTFVEDRPGHDRRYAIDATKIRAELGWRPRHAFEEGLAATVRWYVENAEWCRRVQEGTYDRERLGRLPGGP